MCRKVSNCSMAQTEMTRSKRQTDATLAANLTDPRRRRKKRKVDGYRDPRDLDSSEIREESNQRRTT